MGWFDQIQHPKISQDVKKWNEKETKTMKETINRFIPSIRFYHISSNDTFYKVLPYKKLSSKKKLIYDILEFHMSSNMDLDVEVIQPSRIMRTSNIIESQHLDIFASWIDKKEKILININSV